MQDWKNVGKQGLSERSQSNRLLLLLHLLFFRSSPSKSLFIHPTVNISAQVCTLKKFLLVSFWKTDLMSREVYQVFPAPTLQLIRRHLSLSEAPLSLRLRFSFSLMRFWNLSHAVCCLSACHRSFAHRQIWGVCVFRQAVDYSRPRDWCSLFNMFTCKTRFVGAPAAAAAAVCCFSPSPFSRDCWIKHWKVGLFQSSKHREDLSI